MTNAADIVAYTYQAETLCPTCTNKALSGKHYVEPTGPVNMENVLDFTAPFFGITDRHDENTFDSGDFPKVVFASQIEACGDCDACLEGDPTKCADQLCHACGEEL